MTRSQLRKLFQKHYGESARLARDLGLSRTTVCKWFQGHVTSTRIQAAVVARARDLQARERPSRIDAPL
jgi:AraC-like DNA-binding protein